MTSILVDLVKVQVLSVGTGNFSLGAASEGFRGVEALINGGIYSYSIQSGSQYEVGTGTYFASGGILVRNPEISSNGNAAVSFPANVEIKFVARAADIAPPGTLPIVQATGQNTDVAMSQKATTDALTAIAGSAITLTASEPIDAGNFVNIYDSGSGPRIRQADASNPSRFANGFVQTAFATSDSGLVYFFGINTFPLLNATAGQVWLSSSTPGWYTYTAPTASGSIVQPLGPIINTVGLIFFPQPWVLL